MDAYESRKKLYENAMKKQYDILLLDIELTTAGFSDIIDENGMLLADEIKDRYPETLTIFFSRFPTYKRDLLRHEPFGFVNKPIFDETDELFKMIEEAIKKVRHREKRELRYQIRMPEGFSMRIKIRDLLYFESQRPRIRAVMLGEEDLTFRKKLDDVEKELAEITPDFVRVNKSFLANIRYVKEYTSRNVVMIDGMSISIGRKYMTNVREKMKK